MRKLRHQGNTGKGYRSIEDCWRGKQWLWDSLKVSTTEPLPASLWGREKWRGVRRRVDEGRGRGKALQRKGNHSPSAVVPRWLDSAASCPHRYWEFAGIPGAFASDGRESSQSSFSLLPHLPGVWAHRNPLLLHQTILVLSSPACAHQLPGVPQLRTIGYAQLCLAEQVVLRFKLQVFHMPTMAASPSNVLWW